MITKKNKKEPTTYSLTLQVMGEVTKWKKRQTLMSWCGQYIDYIEFIVFTVTVLPPTRSVNMTSNPEETLTAAL